MHTSTSKRWKHLQRTDWLLWGLACSLIVALTITIPVLWVPLKQSLGQPEGPLEWVADAWVASVGLLGLAVLFCLHSVFKQSELHRMRLALLQEEREKEDIRTRLMELSELFQVSTALHLQLRLDVILEIIVRRVVATLKAQQASIMVWNPESGELETRSSYGLEAEFSRGAKQRMGEGIAGWVAERRESVLLGDKGASPELGRHFKDNRRITSSLSLPLVAGEKVVGVLNVNRINHPDAFHEHHREVLQLFADHVAAVIDRAEAVERLGMRTQELEAANTRLSDMNRLKDVFLSTASHELKTPLSSVIAYAELLDDHDGKLTPEQSGEFVRRLRGEAQRLLALIEDILDLSRLESGKLVLRPREVSIAEVARGAIDTTRSISDKYGVRVQSEFATDLPTLKVDEVKLRQVFVNLIVNAVKFSPREGAVRLVAERDGAFVRVTVHDQGPGIPPDSAVHIFELFGQGVPQRDGERGGLGIGLHLVRRITELHGGHVGVNSRPGQGAEFWVRLPLAGAPLRSETMDPSSDENDLRAAA